MSLYKFEIKKLFRNKKNKIMILCLIIYLLAMVINNISNVAYVNANGETIEGINAVIKLRAEKEKWNGELTIDTVKKVINNNKEINNNPNYLSNNGELSDAGYYYLQGSQDLRKMINRSFGGMQNYDYYLINTLGESQADKFYENRVNAIEEWLSRSDVKDHYSKDEKNYIIKQFNSMESPIYYSYMDGWKKIIAFLPTLLYAVTIISCIIVANIFTVEYEKKAAPVFFSTFKGRDKAISSKILAALVVVSALYFISVFFILLLFLGVFGTEGANCVIQANPDYWFSMYNITNIQAVAIILVMGFIGCLFMVSITLYMASLTRSSNIAVIFSFLLIMGTGVFGQLFDSSSISKIMNFFPDKLFMGNTLLNQYNILKIANNNVDFIIVLLIIYSVLLVYFLLMTYRRNVCAKEIEVKM